MASVIGPGSLPREVFAPSDFTVGLPGVEDSARCPFCGAAVSLQWTPWDRKQTRGPRGGMLKTPKALPIVVAAEVTPHECAAASADESLPLRRHVAALEMSLTWSFPALTPEERKSTEALIAEKLAELAARGNDDDEPVECVYCAPNRVRPPISLRDLIEKAKSENWPADYIAHFESHLTGE